MRTSIITLMLLLWAFLPHGNADELKPIYVELIQQTSDTNNEHWQVVLKVTERSSLSQIIQLALPNGCEQVTSVQLSRHQGKQVRRYSIACNPGLWEQLIAINGLQYSNADALIRVSDLNKTIATYRLTSDSPSVTLEAPQQGISNNIGSAYLLLGLDHILEGYDHLLFVIAMVFLVKGAAKIALTITAFTVAHSITLIGTTYGIFALPSKPVEAVIALSIVFIAVEVLKSDPNKPSFTESNPWSVAFIFGLLHGFGFAGALAEIGLPQTDVPLALLMFNLGVELGQLSVVAMCLVVLGIINYIKPQLMQAFIRLNTYFIGIIASYWLIERVL